MAAMNTSGIRRNFKNIVHNYSDSQVKVREATSNDPWGPSSTLMSEIADLTYNVVAFSEIMQMIWKRLNDHGKNWRHVYKALVLLEYLIKTGTEKVAQQCKENIFAIQTLKDFQYFEENKDHGMNVREKAKQLVSLLKDDERLKNERTRALKARERFAQSTAGIGSEQQNSTGDGTTGFRYADAYGEAVSPTGEHFNLERRVSSELEGARPQTAGEEELQLQLALAMSKEEAEQEEQKRRSDDVRLQMAITQSEEDFSEPSPGSHVNGGAIKRVPGPDSSRKQQSNLVDLLDMPVPGPSNPMVNTDPWGLPLEQQQQKPVPAPRNQLQVGCMSDLVGLSFRTEPVSMYPTNAMLEIQSNDQWGSSQNHSLTTSPIASDPWVGRPASSQGAPLATSFPSRPSNDPWNASAQAVDPWGTTNNSSFGSSPSLATNGELHTLDPLANQSSSSSKSANNLDYLGLGPNPFDGNGPPPNYASTAKKTPENFLGENSNLVNLDALISSKPPSQMTGGATNPFSMQQQQQAPPPANTFQAQPPPRISLNQMRTQQQFGAMGMSYGADPFAPQMPTPIVPVGQQPLMSSGGMGGPPASNPFL